MKIIIQIFSIASLRLAIAILPAANGFVQPTPLPVPQRLVTGTRFSKRSAPDDDDGWVDIDETNEAAATTVDEASLKLLESLREPDSGSSFTQLTSKEAVERDLFIPIFTLVAIAGFTGAYGYEMLRLYSRGELYLPF